MPTLAGGGHAEVKRYLALRSGRVAAKGRAAIDGLWALRRAVETGLTVEVVFRCPELSRGRDGEALVVGLEEIGVRAHEIAERVALRMSDRHGPDGLFGIVQLPEVTLADMVADPPARLLVLDGLENAGNVGSLLRLADSTGASVLLSDSQLRLEQPKVVHASMATVFHVPVVRVAGDDARGWLRALDYQVVLADPDCPIPYRRADYGSRVALVVGSERYGLTGGWPAAASLAVSLPMLGTADSLNVGHAAAVLMYEILSTQLGL